MNGIFVEDWKDMEKAFEDYYWKKYTKSSTTFSEEVYSEKHFEDYYCKKYPNTTFSEEDYSLFHTSSYSFEYLTKRFAEGPSGKKLEAFRETVKILAKDTLLHHFHAKTRVLDCELCVYVECYHLLVFMEQNKIEIPFAIEDLVPMEGVKYHGMIQAWVKTVNLNLQTRNEMKKARMRMIPLFEDQQSWNWCADFHYSGDFDLKISSPKVLSLTGKRQGSHLHLRADIHPLDFKELISTELDIVHLDITIDLKKTLQIIKENMSRMFDSIPFLVSDLYEPILSYVFLHFE